MPAPAVAEQHRVSAEPLLLLLLPLSKKMRGASMGTTSTLAALSAGVVLGVFISQQYAVPDLKEGVDWLVSECSTMQLHDAGRTLAH